MAEQRDEPSIRFTVTLPAQAVRRIDAVAELRGSSRAAILREAALEWLRRHDPEQDYIDVEQGS